MILVTGGTGLVGSHLLYHLTKMSKRSIRAIKRGKDVTSVLNLFKFYDNNYQKLFNKIEWVEADVTDISSLEVAFEGVEKVFHCAAIISFNPKEKELMHNINVKGTRNIINLSLEYQVKKICHVSSIAALGSAKKNELTSEKCEWKADECTSRYSLSKHLSEIEVWRGFAEGLNTVIINPSAVIGPSERKSGTALIFKTALEGNRFYPLGSNSFVCVNDVAKIMIQLINSSITGEQFIITSENLSHKALGDFVSEALGVRKLTIPITPMLGAFACTIEKVKALFFKHNPLITKEILQEANACVSYSNKKIKEAIGYEFTAIKDAVYNTSKFYTSNR